MDEEKYTKRVTLNCANCGGTQFEFDDQDESEIAIMKCVSCGRETTKQTLIEENDENISAHIEEMGNEVAKDVADELQKSLNKIFKN